MLRLARASALVLQAEFDCGLGRPPGPAPAHDAATLIVRIPPQQLHMA